MSLAALGMLREVPLPLHSRPQISGAEPARKSYRESLVSLAAAIRLVLPRATRGVPYPDWACDEVGHPGSSITTS